MTFPKCIEKHLLGGKIRILHLGLPALSHMAQTSLARSYAYPFANFLPTLSNQMTMDITETKRQAIAANKALMDALILKTKELESAYWEEVKAKVSEIQKVNNRQNRSDSAATLLNKTWVRYIPKIKLLKRDWGDMIYIYWGVGAMSTKNMLAGQKIVRKTEHVSMEKSKTIALPGTYPKSAFSFSANDSWQREIVHRYEEQFAEIRLLVCQLNLASGSIYKTLNIDCPTERQKEAQKVNANQTITTQLVELSDRLTEANGDPNGLPKEYADLLMSTDAKTLELFGIPEITKQLYFEEN